ncbi:hypothetical protein [Shewanella halifaxensis]|uniref:hypothetical protein n=1 Tax=Shewanella halifaxensis TaxID=271098 RepID=UPI0002F542FB|nr:hypothetical protein [Shewanella halifaxensis]
MAIRLFSNIEAFTSLLFCHSDEASCLYSCDALIEGLRTWPKEDVKDHLLLDQQVQDVKNLNACNEDR